MEKVNCVILGAGLSGLACAMTLKRSGIDFLLAEAGSHVGGRVATRTMDGFIIDEGFQVLLNSYPELPAFLDLDKLELKKFKSGAMIYTGEILELLANPLLNPRSLLNSVFQDLVTMKDKILLLKLGASAQFNRVDAPMGETSTESFLKDYGFSDKFIEYFWRPFLTGVYLDSDLGPGAEYFKFLLRSFIRGQATIPAQGMSQIPIQMASNLSAETMRFNYRVEKFDSKNVEFTNGEIIQAENVVCAFDPGSLLAHPRKRDYRKVTTLYFTSEELLSVDWDKWLILIPKKYGFKIDHLTLISSVSNDYGPNRPLLSVSLVGHKNFEVSEIKEEINKIAGQDLKLSFVTSVFVEKALPVVIEEGEGFGVINDVVYCGDSWASPSINGALRSGRLAAEFIIKRANS